MSVEAPPFRILSFKLLRRRGVRVQSRIELQIKGHPFWVVSDYPMEQVDPYAVIDGTDTQELVPRPYEGLIAARGRRRLRRIQNTHLKGTELTTERYGRIPRVRAPRTNDFAFSLDEWERRF